MKSGTPSAPNRPAREHIRASLRTAPLTNVPFMKSDWLTEVNRLTVAETAGGASYCVNRWNLMMGSTGHFKNPLMARSTLPRQPPISARLAGMSVRPSR